MGGEDVDQEKKKREVLNEFVAVNSIFSAAVFMGISLDSPSLTSLEIRPECRASLATAQSIVFYEVLSFACFLLSSVVAKSIGILIALTQFDRVLPSWFKIILFVIIASSSFFGFAFLTTSMSMVIVVKLGKPVCESNHASAAVATLTVFAGIALIIYAIAVIFASKHFGWFRNKVPSEENVAGA